MCLSEQGLDFGTQLGGRGVARYITADTRAQLQQFVPARRTGWARMQMAQHPEPAHQSQLAVHLPFQVRQSLLTSHDRLRSVETSAKACTDGRRRSMARPRASRDMTVPTGTPTTLAISR